MMLQTIIHMNFNTISQIEYKNSESRQILVDMEHKNSHLISSAAAEIACVVEDSGGKQLLDIATAIIDSAASVSAFARASKFSIRWLTTLSI